MSPGRNSGALSAGSRLEKHLSDRTMNACISQLRAFTLFVLHQPWDCTRLPTRKFDAYLPFVPTREEMQIFLSSITDLKFKALLCLMFSSGLRIGKVRHLKCSDIEHSKAVLVFFPCRTTPAGLALSSKKRPSKPIDHQRIPDFILAHEKALGWEHRFTCHTFRHAFATYHYEDGTVLLTLKALMGHRSINSTAIYVHLSSHEFHTVQSPFDRMGGMLND